MSKVIFIAGVHGVGKTFLCNQILNKFSLKTYSASELIEGLKNEEFKNNKKIKDINSNQHFLLEAVNSIRKKEKVFILDGHFCLLNNKGEITRIPKETFLKISPNAIIILYDTSDNINKRLIKRDNVIYDVNLIESFQEEELKYSLEIAQILQVPYLKYTHTEDINKILGVIAAV